ncbi:iron chelate uptake ABC transporter family permease subunit [Actinoplanes bogorensis]|uniref:Iron chelate uptake ABC transporter family permease subunit n=1 Tax=Paractinoplanes bogorensis TaxID=1610840 RepID=A0ABS5YLI0_9ACTN|nr:iron chelate uptake ABC transporter family permease subunit [Actinoplanes bogorensis]MBU2663589.1 iron chelate uptake ABC transporter family permease subunit [Actinoplanes bogorensis]
MSAPAAQTTAVRAIPARVVLLITAAALLVVLCVVSLAAGSKAIPLDEVWRAVFDRTAAQVANPQVDAIVWGVRLPRTVCAVLVGLALGLAGALMQGLTRNPLADPGLLGVSAGASFAIVVAVAGLGVTAASGYVWFALAGALAGAVAVQVLGSLGQGGATPVKIALAGIALTFLLGSCTSAIVLRHPEALNRFRFWSAGSLTGADPALLWRMAPFLVVGAALALMAGPALNSLALGEDTAIALGRRIGLIRLQAVLAITLLAGTAVAIAGPIVFIGLVVPHVARLITGPDHRWLLPATALLAPCLLLVADILGRVVTRPEEVQAGIVVAFLGGPFFIALVRRSRTVEL